MGQEFYVVINQYDSYWTKVQLSFTINEIKCTLMIFKMVECEIEHNR
jgi:hypothetical protein